MGVAFVIVTVLEWLIDGRAPALTDTFALFLLAWAGAELLGARRQAAARVLSAAASVLLVVAVGAHVVPAGAAFLRGEDVDGPDLALLVLVALVPLVLLAAAAGRWWTRRGDSAAS
ncbi:hypothetical protein [Streptomyces sp. NPDC047928]|uniref:hypothetical protein n=1 Tax=unclassified Streptomyces TaxID=2593676 RepID=UPI0037115F2E